MKNFIIHRICLSFIPLLGIVASHGAEIEPTHSLRHLAEILEKRNTASYDVSVIKKFFSYTDTIRFNGTATLIRNESDTLLGGYIFYSNNDWGNGILYDQQTIYSYSVRDSFQSTKYLVAESDVFAITGSVSELMVNWNFLTPASLNKIADNSALQLSIRPDALQDGRECYAIGIVYPDDGDLTKRIKTLYISKEMDDIYGYSFRASFQGEQQYDSVTFINTMYDVSDLRSFTKLRDSLDSSLDWVEYKEPDESFYDLLPEGVSAPMINGTDPITGAEVSLSDFKGKVIILDFFYMSCLPCIKSIPKFSALQEKFRDKGLVVLGINSKDNTPGGKTKLPEFMEKNKMGYQVILVDDSVDIQYNIKAYPSMYIIGRDGKILTSLLGFAEEMDVYLTEYLNKAL